MPPLARLHLIIAKDATFFKVPRPFFYFSNSSTIVDPIEKRKRKTGAYSKRAQNNETFKVREVIFCFFQFG